MVACEPKTWTETINGVVVRWKLSKDGILKAGKQTGGKLRNNPRL